MGLFITRTLYIYFKLLKSIFLAYRNHMLSYSQSQGCVICFSLPFFFFLGYEHVLISRPNTVACTVYDVLSNPAPLDLPDLKSKHTALLWAMLSCRRNSCLYEFLMYAHIGVPLKQMRMWRITSIPVLSCFKSPPFQNVSFTGVHHLKMLQVWKRKTATVV